MMMLGCGCLIRDAWLRLASELDDCRQPPRAWLWLWIWPCLAVWFWSLDLVSGVGPLAGQAGREAGWVSGAGWLDVTLAVWMLESSTHCVPTGLNRCHTCLPSQPIASTPRAPDTSQPVNQTGISMACGHPANQSYRSHDSL